MRLAALFVLLLSACSTGDLGASCTSHDDCEDVLLCGAAEGVPYCTRRCRPSQGAAAQGSSGCPEGWTCTPRASDPSRGLCTE